MKATPYTKTYIHTKDIDQFFSYDPKLKEMVFTSTSLKVIIPQRYSVYNLLDISDTVTTLGVVDLIIDETFQAGLLLLTTIEMEPDDVSTIMVGDLQYVVVTLSQGSRFICNTERIADSTIVYALWMEFITRGKLIYNIGYDALATLFDQAGPMCDANLGVDHVLFECIYAHLTRSSENLAVQYRHTDRTEPFKFIELRNVGYATTSTTSRLMGSYFSSALNSSLIQTNTEQSDVESLLRA
jgi:hypothetical protein